MRRFLARPVSAVGLVLMLAGLLADPAWPRPAPAREVAEVPGRGCAASAYDALDQADGVLTLSSPDRVPILSVTLTHPCPGPLYVKAVVTLLLAPSAVEDAYTTLVAEATCVGGGCEIGGASIESPGQGGVVADQGGGQRPSSVPLLTVFPDLPRGTYVVEILANGARADLLVRFLRVWSAGHAEGGGRIGAP
jgi:hypothetical protein